jgi:DNA-binding winged helix-turn-helix (wHTH) protein/TolB-like protein/Tfp pilus assembly protein PilF
MSLDNYPGFLLNFSECGMNGEDRHCYRFKSFRLNVDERQLLYNSSPVPLTPKAFDVLVVLVERSGHLVGKDELLKRVWGDSFVEEANVARIVHTLRKALGEDENGNKFIETVAKKGYRFVAQVAEIHEPAALQSALPQPDAAHFIETPIADQASPVKADKAVTQLADSPKQKRRIILFAVGFLSAVFLIVLVAFNFQSKPSFNANKVHSIAVLPLQPINTTTRDELYEIGIADSLIHRLSLMKGFIVRPLSATRKYVDIEQNPIAAGKEQQVDYVLASNYQLAGGKIRITTQLFNLASERVEATHKIEKEASDVFAVQDAIASEVGNKLLTLFATTSSTTMAKRGTTSEEAYRLYLQGKNLTMKRNASDARKAIAYFEQAIQLDPNYALAYAELAHAYIPARINHSGLSQVENEKAKELINKALELDNNLAKAHVVRADLKLIYEWDFAAVEKDLLRAIELEPSNDQAHWLYALLLAYRGRFDEAMVKIETALAINPGALMYLRDRGKCLYFARRYDEAIVQLKRVIELDESFGTAYDWLWEAYEMNGDETQAYAMVMDSEKQENPERAKIYQKTYEMAGWQGVKRKILEFWKLDKERSEKDLFLKARLCAVLGDREEAFALLNRAVENREWRVITLMVDPPLDSLRADPRFDELVRRVGLK